MAYVFQENSLGFQPIADVSTTQKHPFGTIVRAHDPDYGSAEFIYLKGVASTVVGSWVTYNVDDWTTALLVANAIGPVAVAMSVCDAATDFGWYMVQGKGKAKAADVSDDGNLYASSVAGVVDDAVVTGDRVQHAKAASADDSLGFIDIEIHRPFVNDGIGAGAT